MSLIPAKDRLAQRFFPSWVKQLMRTARHALFVVPILVCGSAVADSRYLDPDYSFSSSSLPNPVLGVILLIGLTWACFMFSVLRITAYVFSGLLTLGVIIGTSSGELLFISLPILMGCIAGTLWHPEDGLLVKKQSDL